MQRYSSRNIHWLLVLMSGLVLSIATVGWAGSKTTLSPAAKAGKKLFNQNCGTCHFANETGRKVGPGLKGILKNKELPYSHKPATVANVRETIEKGISQGRPIPMPAVGANFSKTEMNNLIAYLKTL